MNDPRYSEPSSEPLENTSGSARANMAESLRQALRDFGGDRTGAGGLTPEMLTELAQRAGISSPSQVADLARMVGLGSDALENSGVPQHIVFMLGDVECALPAETVQGVERVTDIAPVPNTVFWVLGIVHLRGTILSVVDLRGFLGLPAQPASPRSRMLVVTKRDMTIGMVVDGVTEMRPLGADQVGMAPLAPTPAWAEPYAVKAINIEGRGIVMLDPERLLYADKMHRYRDDFS